MSMSTLVVGGTPVKGHPIDVLVLDARHAIMLGHIQHAMSFSFPVFYRVLSIK